MLKQPVYLYIQWSLTMIFLLFMNYRYSEHRRNYLLNYSLTPRSSVLLEKLPGSQLVKKIPSLCGTRRFITVFTRARHLSLSWARSIQSMPPHPTSWRFILILSYHLRLGFASGLFPSDFPTKIVYTPLLSRLRATCPTNLILLQNIGRKTGYSPINAYNTYLTCP
jgi:hypothetical protein